MKTVCVMTSKDYTYC